MKEFFERLQIKHDLKREYFTLGIPVAVAVIFIILSVTLGMVKMPGEGGAAVQKDERQKAYEELLKQMNEGGDATPVTETPAKPAAKKLRLEDVLIFATLIAVIPYSIDITLQKRKTRKKEELYTEFLFKLSELMRGGLDPIKSVKELSKTDLGDLGPHVRMASTALTYGKTFEESMKAMAASLHSELIRRYTQLVVQASYSGGSVSDLILRASEDMRSIIGIEREKEGNLSQYVFIFYFAQGIIVFIAYIMLTSLLPFMANMGSTTMMGGANLLAGLDFANGFFNLIMINAFFGGLIIGKITEGDVKYGLKHCAILMAGCYIAGMIFLVPPVADQVTGKINITVVSGDEQLGVPGLPLPKPIIVKITDLDGKPKENDDVKFSITPDGKVTPSSDRTTKDGNAQVKVILGASHGPYFIEANAENVKKRIQIKTSTAGTG